MSNTLERWFDNRRLSPVRESSQIQDSLDRMMNDFLTIRKTNDVSEAGFAPSCEITDEGNSYVMMFDLPGVSKENVHVEADRDSLTIRAERKEESKHTGKRKHLSEIYYGSYARTFTLPGTVDEKKIDAKFDNGVLTVTVPKTETLKAKQIPIH